MAKLDNSIHHGPNYNSNTIESITMYRNNNTSDWLQDKNEPDRQQIIKLARTTNKKFTQEVLNRKQKLMTANMDIIHEREKLKKLHDERKRREKQAVLNTIKDIGIWDCRERIIYELEKLKTKKEQICVLKKQITMCKQLFNCQNKDKHLLQFSSKGKQHDIQILTENLIQLIEKEKERNKMSIYLNDPEELVAKNITHVWENNSGPNSVIHKWNF